jgi:hypothetical protein
MPELKTPAYYLDSAEKLLTQGGGFTKEREAVFRSILKLSEAAAALNGSAAKNKRGIAYSSPEERSAFLTFLRTGRGESRDMGGGGGAYPGSAGSPLVPVGFEKAVVEAEKLFN